MKEREVERGKEGASSLRVSLGCKRSTSVVRENSLFRLRREHASCEVTSFVLPGWARPKNEQAQCHLNDENSCCAIPSRTRRGSQQISEDVFEFSSNHEDSGWLSVDFLSWLKTTVRYTRGKAGGRIKSGTFASRRSYESVRAACQCSKLRIFVCYTSSQLD